MKKAKRFMRRGGTICAVFAHRVAATHNMLDQPERKSIVSDINETLAGREPQNGDYTEHSGVTDALLQVLESSRNWQNLDPSKRHSLRMICDKMARITCGDPETVDFWHDIQGYAKLAEDRCVTEADRAQLDLYMKYQNAAPGHAP